MPCPDCGSDKLVEMEVEREFQVGSKNPVTLTAKAPVEVCSNCDLELHGWQMEQARCLAMSAYAKANRPLDIEVPDDLRVSHAVSSLHRKQLEHTGQCGCFYCLQVFPVSLIEEWIDHGETALCPKCGIDSVIPVTDDVSADFLKRMQQFWFHALAAI